jgi:hypothetical protein
MSLFLGVIRGPFHFSHSHHSNFAIVESVTGVTDKFETEPKCFFVTFEE